MQTHVRLKYIFVVDVLLHGICCSSSTSGWIWYLFY